MNHRWDDVTRRAQEARRERERYAAPRIEEDPDVARRDRIARQRRAPQCSPWEVGIAFHDQRDLYTRDGRIDASGYARGPSEHPEEGSYAYRREPATPHKPLDTGASVYERQAWPWLNYHAPAPADDGVWSRLKEGAVEVKERLATTLHVGPRPAVPGRTDDLIRHDVEQGLAERADIDATDVEVTVREAEVTLTGTVPDRQTKRLAEEVAEGVIGVRDVHNRLTIRPEDPTDANVAFVLPLALLGT